MHLPCHLAAPMGKTVKCKQNQFTNDTEALCALQVTVDCKLCSIKNKLPNNILPNNVSIHFPYN